MSGGLWVEKLQPPLDVSGKYYVSSCISFSSSVQVLAEHGKGQLILLSLVAPCWMEAPWLPTALNMVADIPWHCPIIKDLIMDVLVGYVLKGLAISAFSPLVVHRCVLCKQGFSSSVCQAMAGATQASMSKVYQQCWKEWAGWCT